MVRKFETIHYGIQISLSKQWWHCSQFDISQRKLVRRLIKAAVQELDLVILNWVSQNEFKVCSYVLTHMHRQTDTQTTHTHTHRPYNMCHIWSWAITLCFWRQSSCRPVGFGFDHCVQEVRFVEFGPAHCPSSTRLLTQKIVSWDRVVWSLEVHNQACETHFTAGTGT